MSPLYIQFWFLLCLVCFDTFPYEVTSFTLYLFAVIRTWWLRMSWSNSSSIISQTLLMVTRLCSGKLTLRSVSLPVNLNSKLTSTRPYKTKFSIKIKRNDISHCKSLCHTETTYTRHQYLYCTLSRRVSVHWLIWVYNQITWIIQIPCLFSGPYTDRP